MKNLKPLCQVKQTSHKRTNIVWLLLYEFLGSQIQEMDRKWNMVTRGQGMGKLLFIGRASVDEMEGEKICGGDYTAV